jgi:hypothetical protein
MVIDRGSPRNWEIKLIQCQFVCHQSHMELSETDTDAALLRGCWVSGLTSAEVEVRLH